MNIDSKIFYFLSDRVRIIFSNKSIYLCLEISRRKENYAKVKLREEIETGVGVEDHTLSKKNHYFLLIILRNLI